MRHAFEAALADAERAPPDEPAPVAIRLAPLPLTPEAGGHSLWEMAAAWTPEADPPPPPPPPPPAPPRPSAEPDDVARELNIATLSGPREVARARRRFMWENHPDRRADLDRDLANRRVAVANMLLDRALAEIAGRRAR